MTFAMLLGCALDDSEETTTSGGDDGHICEPGDEGFAPQQIAALDFRPVTAGAVAADGSVTAVGDWPAQVARFSSDGVEVWRAPLKAEGSAARFGSVLVGEEVVVVGNVGSVGTLWRFAADGTPLSVDADAGGRSYITAAQAPDGGMVLVADQTVEWRAADGSVSWSQDFELPDVGSVMAAAAPSADRVFLAGGIGGAGQPLMLRVVPGEVEQTTLPSGFFHGIAPTPQGGAVAVGQTANDQIVAAFDDTGALLWTSECGQAELDGVADHVFVEDDRVVIAGRRIKPEPGCTDACSGAHFVWLRELSLDGSVVTTFAPEGLTEPLYPFESVAALGLDPSGSIIALADTNDGALLLRFVE